MFTYTQKIPITTALRGPYWVTFIPHSLKIKCRRQKFSCAYKACKVLQDWAKVERPNHHGGDVSDNNGTIIAEAE